MNAVELIWQSWCSDASLNVAVSKHIRVLERARLVRRRRVWREQRVRIDVARLNGLADWIAGQRTVWIDCLNALDALLTAEDAEAGANKLAQENRK